MSEKKSRRVYAGYYNRYDGKLIYVARVVTDIDTGEDIVICQYANYSDTGEYYTITKASFCEQVERNGQMVNKYSRRTQQKIDRRRLLIQEENDLSEPKRRPPGNSWMNMPIAATANRKPIMLMPRICVSIT